MSDAECQHTRRECLKIEVLCCQGEQVLDTNVSSASIAQVDANTDELYALELASISRQPRPIFPSQFLQYHRQQK